MLHHRTDRFAGEAAPPDARVEEIADLHALIRLYGRFDRAQSRTAIAQPDCPIEPLVQPVWRGFLDHTRKMLRQFGVAIDYAPGHARLRGGQRLAACDVEVPADFSSAAFFLVAASIVPGSDLLLEAVGMNPRRTGLLASLREMGADIAIEREAVQGGEAVADLRVRHAPLHGIEVPIERVPDMIDEFPALFVAAAAAAGPTVVRGAAELRVKESDRLATMSTALRTLGARIDETPDGATIHGGRPLAGGHVHAHGDHRIAMSAAIAGQIASGPVTIDDCDNVATSFPGFVELATAIGFDLAARRHT